MATTPTAVVALSSQFYRALLVLFPPRFRAEYEHEMVLVFRDSLRAARRSGSSVAVLFFWLAAILDVGQAAVHEWFVHRPGPGHHVQQLGLGLVAGAAGGAVAGLAARVAMRGVALAGGLQPGFTWLGTVGIVVIGIIMGLPFGVGFMPVRTLMPGSGVWKGLTYGLLLFLVFLAPPLMFYREGEAQLASPLVGAGLFAPVCLAYGAALAFAVQRLERRLRQTAASVTEPKPASPWPAVARQVVALGAFALLLELAVLGTLSITRSLRPIPPDIVRAARDAGLPFKVLWDGNRWLVNLSLLGYFGLASLLFWNRSRLPMARFTAVALLLFGVGLFNTGAAYYARLIANLASLHAAFNALQVLGVTALLGLFYLFPHGRLAAGWARPLAVAWLGFAAVWLVVPLPDALTFTVTAVFLVSGLAVQLQHFRAAASGERPQLRWPVIGFAVAVVGFCLVAPAVLAWPGVKLTNLDGLRGTATFGLYMLPWLFIPMTIGYAMRRHRLWAT